MDCNLPAESEMLLLLLRPGGVPAGEGSSSTLTEDLTHPQDMKNPGQDGYQPAQACMARPRLAASHRARVPLKVMAQAPVPAACHRAPRSARQRHMARIMPTRPLQAPARSAFAAGF